MKPRALLLFLLLVPNFLAQTTAPATIRGVLVRWGTEEPVSQATIELRSTTGASPIAIGASGGNGEFVFPNIPPGAYRIVALADGFAPAEYGQTRQNGSGRPIAVGAGERTNFKMGIVPGGVLAGKVTDQTGQPLVYSAVEILKPTYDATGQINPVIALTVTTNDLGEYRAFWLAPGPYMVRAGSSQLNSFVNQGTINPMGTDTSIPTTSISSTGRPRARAAPVDNDSPESAITPVLSVYYGGAPDARSGQVIEVRSGAESVGIDIRVAPVQFSRRVRLNGVVVSPAGPLNQAFFGLSLSTWPEGQSTVLASIRSMTTRVPSTNPNTAPGTMAYVMDNGKFEGAASSGFYQIRATQGALSGRVVVEAGNQDLNVTVPLHPPSTVSGRVQIEGGANSNFDLAKLQVGIRTPPSNFFSSPVAADGQFRIDGVIDGDYQVNVLPIENAYVKSIRVNNSDLLNSPIRIDGTQTISGVEIVLGASGGSVEGRIVNARQEVVDRATVVLLPQGPPPFREDRYRTLTTDKSGQFQFRGLPPGEYRVIAWEDVDPGAWFNPAFLAAYERFAASIALSEGKAQRLDLTAIPVGP